MANAINTAKTFDETAITFSKPMKNKMGGNMVYMNYGGDKGKVCIQTPMMYAPFGLSKLVDDKTGATKWSLDVSFRDAPGVSEYRKVMESLDVMIKKKAVENSVEWFGKQHSVEIIEELYRPIVKPAKDPSKYAPTMKAKLMERDGVFQAKVYDHETREAIDVMDITKGSHVQMIVQCDTVWFVGKTQFGVTWKLVQARVMCNKPAQEIAFIEDDDED